MLINIANLSSHPLPAVKENALNPHLHWVLLFCLASFCGWKMAYNSFQDEFFQSENPDHCPLKFCFWNYFAKRLWNKWDRKQCGVPGFHQPSDLALVQHSWTSTLNPLHNSYATFPCVLRPSQPQWSWVYELLVHGAVQPKADVCLLQMP